MEPPFVRFPFESGVLNRQLATAMRPYGEGIADVRQAVAAGEREFIVWTEGRIYGFDGIRWMALPSSLLDGHTVLQVVR